MRLILISGIFSRISRLVWKNQSIRATNFLMKRVLCVLENGFEEIEAITPVDVLRRAGMEVVLAGVSGTLVTGKNGIRIEADVLLEILAAEGFDALFLPGGPAVMDMRKNAQISELIRGFYVKDKLIAAICAAPLLLQDAGILEGRKFTAHFTTNDELPENCGERVVTDGALITSRGAGTALDFGLEMVAVLAGATVRDEVATGIMA